MEEMRKTMKDLSRHSMCQGKYLYLARTECNSEVTTEANLLCFQNHDTVVQYKVVSR
jgi:hypothetical protein